MERKEEKRLKADSMLPVHSLLLAVHNKSNSSGVMVRPAHRRSLIRCFSPISSVRAVDP